MRKNKQILVFLFTLLFLIGLGIFLYPTVNRLWVDIKMEAESNSFYDALENAVSPNDNGQTTDIPDTTDATEELLYPELLEEMQAYNRQLYLDGQKDLNSTQAYTRPSFVLSDYGLDTEVFAVISIPKLELAIPVYLGATNQHLSDGAAVLGQTSIPIGGANTNAVIAGHRGWKGADYFRYITELEPGDTVTVTNLWETLTYEVIETQIIEPYEVDKILIRPGEDLLTLLTCHPYASGGRQRYLVFCDRIQ